MRTSHRIGIALAALLSILSGNRTSAATRLWVDGTGNWSVPGNWNPFGVPAGGDDVYVTNFDGVSRTINYDYSGFPLILNSLNIGLTGGVAGASETLEMTNSTLDSSVEYIGTSLGASGGSATFNQSTGSNLVGGGGMYIGTFSADSGIYNLGGNGSLSSSGSEFLAAGPSSTATFNQSGGTNTLSSIAFLEVGVGLGSIATYSLSGGSLTTGAGGEFVGYAGAGTFSHSGSATNTINSGGSLYLGFGSASTGTYLLGDLASLSVSGSEYVGDNGAGTFNQFGGSNGVGSSLYVAYSGLSNGDYELSTGSLTVSNFEFVGYSGTGLFQEFSGTNSPGLTLYLGYNAGSIGTYNLGGNGFLLPGANEIVGDNGSGNFTQSGGTNTIPSGNILYLGYGAGSSGTYALSSGTLIVNGLEYVGFSGTGSFNQSGGSHTISNDLVLAVNSGSSAAFSLSGSGSLTVLGSEYVGRSGVGTFTQTGGSNEMAFASTLYLGYSAGSSGTYTLAGGLLSLPVNGNEYIGFRGAGTFNHSAGVNSLSKSLYLGYLATANGTYSLSGSGALALTNSPLYVGYSGTGTFIQSGGSNAVNSASVYLAYDIGSTGSYSLSGGSFMLSGSGVHEFLGNGVNSNASFTQTGGTNQINGATNNLYVGYGTGASATYSLSGGSLLLGGSLNIGIIGGGSGTMTVSDSGQLTVGKSLQVAPGSVLNLHGGQINVSALSFTATPALFNWTTGTLNITTDVTWDPSITSTTSAAFGPALTLATGQTLMVSGNETIGGIAPFTLELGAGSSHVVTGSLTVNPAGTLTIRDGSSLTVFSSFLQNGGTVNGTLQAAGAFTYSGGTFNGQLITQGAAAFSSNFTAAGGIENDGTLTISGPRTLKADGPGLDNFGTITLAAGQTLAGTTIVNDVGGSISSSGTIAAPFTNLGTLAENATSGTILVSGAMLNYGLVGPITGGVNFRPSGGLDNGGVIQLNGGSISGSGAVINDFGGLIQSGVGSSAEVVVSGVSAPLTNSGGVIVVSANTIMNLTSFAGGNVNGGEIRVQNSATLTSPLAFPNSGTILLEGAAATLAGGALANTGTISGLGRVTNQTDNDGVIQAIDGTLTLAAAGNTNDAATGSDPGGQIQVGTGCGVIFSQGLSVNAGSIALAGGSFDNNNRPITNAATGFIIGAGTFKSGGLTNNGIVRFADNPTSVYGSVTTATPGSLVNLINNTTTFYGPVTIADDSSLITDNATARFLATLSGNVTSQLANKGAIEMSGVSGMYGKVANEGRVSVHAGGNATFYGPFSGAGSVINRGALTFNSPAMTNNIGGPLTNDAAAKLTVTGGGALEIDAAPTLADASSILVTSGSRLTFNVQAGSATVGGGVTATVASTGTFELAGSVSALANGANRVNITNNSNSAGLLVSGTNQQVGNIDGSGTTQVNAGSDLTADHIVQNALMIGGAAGSTGLVTIDASDASGNPLGQSSGFALAGSLTRNDPFEAGGIDSANLRSGDNTDLASLSPGNSAAGGNLSPVPEPSALVLALLAILGVVSTQFARRYSRRQTG